MASNHALFPPNVMPIFRRAMVAIADGPVVSLAAYTTRSAFPMAGNLRIPYGVISWAELVRGSADFNWFDLDDD